ncbi:hypothetical protein ACVFYP_17385 [Roseomonas sp. F4]
MTSLPTVFADGIIDVHVASGVARITLGAQTAASSKDNKPEPSALLVLPVLQLPNLAKVLMEVTRQIEAKARETMQTQQTQQQQQAEAGGTDQVAGAFRFNG